MTPKGPRQRTICSLGHLKPRPRKEWLLLAQKVETALKGQLTFEEKESEIEEILEKAKAFESQEKRAPKDKGDDVIAIHTSWLTVKDTLKTHQVSNSNPSHHQWRNLKDSQRS